MHTRVAIVCSTGLVLLAALAACTDGSPGSPSPDEASAALAGSPSVAPAATASSSVQAATLPPSASAAPGATSPGAGQTSGSPSGPPTASLMGLAGSQLTGDLGTASWDGTVSDAPWIVGPAWGRAAPGSRLTVAFDPAIRPTSWRARWAPVRGREVGVPRSGGSGTSKTISVTAPEQAGAWSLLVEATFGPDASGAWYWRVQVGR